MEVKKWHGKHQCFRVPRVHEGQLSQVEVSFIHIKMTSHQLMCFSSPDQISSFISTLPIPSYSLCRQWVYPCLWPILPDIEGAPVFLPCGHQPWILVDDDSTLLVVDLRQPWPDAASAREGTPWIILGAMGQSHGIVFRGVLGMTHE